MFSENIINLTCCIIIKIPAFRVYNDLNLYKNLEKFKQVDEDLAKEGLKVLGNL